MNEGFDRQVETLDDAANRLAIFTKQDTTDSSETLFYRAIILRKANVKPGNEEIPISGRRLVDKELVRYGENTTRVQDNLEENLPTAEIKALLKEAKAQSSDRLSFAKRIYQLALDPNDIRVQAIRRKQYHIYNILGGMFSLGGQTDVAIIECAVQFDPVFNEIAYQGVPDIRVIVYHGVPAMAMLRLPTRASDGKANLHRGGVGVGIDLSTGTTLAGIQNNRYIDNHAQIWESQCHCLVENSCFWFA